MGDEIVIGPSGAIANQSDKKFISAIISENQVFKITLSENVKYFHFGDPEITIT